MILLKPRVPWLVYCIELVIFGSELREDIVRSEHIASTGWPCKRSKTRKSRGVPLGGLVKVVQSRHCLVTQLISIQCMPEPGRVTLELEVPAGLTGISPNVYAIQF